VHRRRSTYRYGGPEWKSCVLTTCMVRMTLYWISHPYDGWRMEDGALRANRARSILHCLNIAIVHHESCSTNVADFKGSMANDGDPDRRKKHHIMDYRLG
jgi:hypothetical protein